jgi:DNA (cytosine-5)-methyltransferase 1
MNQVFALSLFSGIGGIDLAVEATGIETIAFCENNPFCQAILRQRWPDVPIFEDIHGLTGDMIKEAIGHGRTIDVIHGGFPCQPFSVAGDQKGKGDNRYLWPEFSRLVSEIKPVWVVAENVPGIMRIAADDVCSDLERLGYGVGIWQYEAAAVGALHRRMRVFFVAYSKSRRSEPRLGERGWYEKKDGERPVNPSPGSSEPSGFVPHSGRRMFQRGAVEGAFRREPEERSDAVAERSGGASLPSDPTTLFMRTIERYGQNGILLVLGGVESPRIDTRDNGEDGTFFPTPKSTDGDKGTRTLNGVKKELKRGHGIDLPAHVQLYPTPRSCSGKRSGGANRSEFYRIWDMPKTQETKTMEGAQNGTNQEHEIDLPILALLYPTPTVNGNHNCSGASKNSENGLATLAKLYPTPTANDAKNNNPPSQKTENGRHSDQLNVIAGGALNPAWVEWLMGFPIGWTDLSNVAKNVEYYLSQVIDGLPEWLCAERWWGQEPSIPRVSKRVKKRVSRLKALGNAVVPAQIVPIFKSIVEVETDCEIEEEGRTLC